MNIVASRLSNQHFFNPLDSVESVVRHFGAVQAQDFVGAVWAVSLRLSNVSKVDIDSAFNAGKILRTHVMRPTWHFVLPEDILWMTKLTAPRINQAMAYYNRKLELDDVFFLRSNKIITDALAKKHIMTRSEIAQVLADNGIDAKGQRLGHIVMQAEIDGLICSGPLRGKQFTYSLVDERAQNAKDLSRDESLALLARRYFTSHGPATLQDFTWWSGLTVVDAKHALDLVKKEFVCENNYWFKGSDIVLSTVPHILLLSVYDEYVIAYKDYSPIFTDETKSLTNIFGNAVLNYVVVKDGIVIGSFRRTVSPKKIILEFDLSAKLPVKYKTLLMLQMKKYSSFLNIPVELIE